MTIGFFYRQPVLAEHSEGMRVMESALPERQGLYDPANEHDACGVGFVAHFKGQKSLSIRVKMANSLNFVSFQYLRKPKRVVSPHFF